MSDVEFPGNSKNVIGNTTQPEKPKKDIQKVITGEVVQRPKTIGRKFKAIFVSRDLKGAATFIFKDVMIPACKATALEMLNKGGERVLYGPGGSPRRYSPLDSLRQSYFSYNKPVEQRGISMRSVMLPDQPPHYAIQPRGQERGDIILGSRDEAELVVERFTDLINTFNSVTIAELNELLGLPVGPHTDQKWGWTSVKGVSIKQVR